MRIVVGVGDLMHSNGDGRTGQVLDVGRLRCLMTLCAIYTVHEKTRNADFLVKPQN
jgi:hypothetical protein